MARPSISKPTATRRGTVLVPFEDLKGGYVVVEITTHQWRRIVADVNLAFAHILHQKGLAADIADIDKWEALT